MQHTRMTIRALWTTLIAAFVFTGTCSSSKASASGSKGNSTKSKRSSSGRTKAKSTKPKTPERSAREIAQEFFNAGLQLQNEQKYADAIQKYHIALRHDTKYAESYNNMAYCYRKRKIYDKAVQYYKVAINLQPNMAEAHEYLGEAYAELAASSFAKARKYLRSAEKELKILQGLNVEQAAEVERYIEKVRTYMGK